MVNEEQTTKEAKTEDTTTNSNEGDDSQTLSELDRADQIAERQTRENDRREAILQREENLAARKAVGGVTEAGTTQEKPKEESPQDYAKRIMANQAQ